VESLGHDRTAKIGRLNERSLGASRPVLLIKEFDPDLIGIGGPEPGAW
jgi:hypothetical protein